MENLLRIFLVLVSLVVSEKISFNIRALKNANKKTVSSQSFATVHLNIAVLRFQHLFPP